MQQQLAHMAEEWRGSAQDKSFLLRGSRLEMFEGWIAETGLAVTSGEREFLNASLTLRRQEQAAEQERQAREVRLEQRSRNFLRGLAAVLVAATLGAFALTGFALNQRNTARRNEAEARSLALASSAQLALNEGNIEQAIELAEAALDITDNALARRVSGQAAFAPQTPPIFRDTETFVPGVFDDDDTELKFVLVAHFGPGIPFSDSMIAGMEDACALVNAACQWLGTWETGVDDMGKHWK